MKHHHHLHRLLLLAIAAWLVWCPVVFTLPALSAPSCHGEQQEAMDCCQPVVGSSAPAVTALPAVSAPLPDAETALAQPALPGIEARPMPRAAPLAGWGRLYASVSVFLI